MIIITNQRVIFQPHLFNIQRDVVEIPLKEIVDVGEVSTYGLISNGMSLKTRSGKEYKFVLPEREKIIDLIKKSMDPLKTA
jgi:GRAM domain